MILSVVIVVNTNFPITVIYVTGQDDPCDLQRILWKSAVAAHQGLQDLLQANESPPPFSKDAGFHRVGEAILWHPKLKTNTFKDMVRQKSLSAQWDAGFLNLLEKRKTERGGVRSRKPV